MNKTFISSDIRIFQSARDLASPRLRKIIDREIRKLQYSLSDKQKVRSASKNNNPERSK